LRDLFDYKESGMTFSLKKSAYLFSHGGAGAAATMNDACSGGPWAAIEATAASRTE